VVFSSIQSFIYHYSITLTSIKIVLEYYGLRVFNVTHNNISAI